MTDRKYGFSAGDLVRIDIPDRDDPDFTTWHGREGVIVNIQQDNAGMETGDERDSVDYLVKFDKGEKMHFRWRDLRPLSPD